MAVAQRRRLQKSGVAATRGVGLQDTDGAGCEHAVKVSRVPAIFAGGDRHARRCAITQPAQTGEIVGRHRFRSEEHTSELQLLMRISYAVFCCKKQTYLS